MLTNRLDDFDGKHLVIETRNLREDRLRVLLADLIRETGLGSADAQFA
jgi:hypothetical protein